MDGKFRKKKVMSYISSGIYFISSVFLIVLFALLESDGSPGDILIQAFFILFGAFGVFLSLLLMFSGTRMRLHADENGITGRTAFGRKLNINIDEIDGVAVLPMSLEILLKSGRRISVTMLENASDLKCYISSLLKARGGMRRSEGSIEEKKKELVMLVAKHKDTIKSVITSVIAMFASIVVAVILTGGDELDVFDTTQWAIFAGCSLIGMIAMFMSFVCATRAGRIMSQISACTDDIRYLAITKTPLPSGNRLKVFTDDDFRCRVTVLKLPSDMGFYYVTEGFNAKLELVKQEESKIFETYESLEEDLGELDEIEIKN